MSSEISWLISTTTQSPSCQRIFCATPELKRSWFSCFHASFITAIGKKSSTSFRWLFRSSRGNSGTSNWSSLLWYQSGQGLPTSNCDCSSLSCTHRSYRVCSVLSMRSTLLTRSSHTWTGCSDSTQKCTFGITPSKSSWTGPPRSPQTRNSS